MARWPVSPDGLRLTNSLRTTSGATVSHLTESHPSRF